VVVKNLRKVYDDKVAVQDVSFHLNSGECFGLLGPNGAGKTTTISVLTGLVEPSGGAGYIVGHDIATDMDDVHQNIGVCPQFDIFWENLTVEETLLFYSRLRGIPKARERESVNTALARVALQMDLNKRVSELSGGMKRRLSVAVSLVGEPSVIFFDEPSTGLDVENRRHLWDVLLGIKANKCIILTTHSMEEADVLCDRISIVASGLLTCFGTNTSLKAKFGSGYHVKLNYDVDAEDKVLAFVKSSFPNSEVAESFPGNLTFRVPDLVVSSTIELFLQNKESLQIRDFGISQTSLEDVFLNIVKTEEAASQGQKK